MIDEMQEFLKWKLLIFKSSLKKFATKFSQLVQSVSLSVGLLTNSYRIFGTYSKVPPNRRRFSFKVFVLKLDISWRS